MDRLFTSRHHASLTVWWNLSPLPVHGVKSRCWRQLRDALYVAGTCLTRTFPQLRSPPPSCEPRDKRCTSQNKEELFSICPANYPRTSGTWPPHTTPHPLARRAGLVPVVAQGVVTTLIEPYINDILENQKPISLFSSRLCASFWLLFSVLTEIFGLEEIHNHRGELVMGFWQRATGRQYLMGSCVVGENNKNNCSSVL